MAVNLTENRVSVSVTAAKTLTAADCGIVQNFDQTGVVITLPATVAGLTYTFRIGGDASEDESMTCSISPNAADQVIGLGVTPADDTDLVCVNGNSGTDFVTLVGNGTTGWVVSAASGTWALAA